MTEGANSLPTSTYSALGVLRQDPGCAAESPAEAQNLCTIGVAECMCRCQRSDRTGTPKRGCDSRESPECQCVRPSRPPLRQGGSGADRRRRAALCKPGGKPRPVDRRPVRPPRRRAEGARRYGPEGVGPGSGDPPADRSPAGTASLRFGPLPRPHRQRGRPRARVHRATRPHGQRRSSAAGRLALPRGRAVLRSDPCQPDGSDEPPQVSLDPRSDQRLLGRGVQHRWDGRA